MAIKQSETTGHKKVEKVQKVMVTSWQFVCLTLNSYNFQSTYRKWIQQDSLQTLGSLISHDYPSNLLPQFKSYAQIKRQCPHCNPESILGKFSFFGTSLWPGFLFLSSNSIQKGIQIKNGRLLSGALVG